MSEYAQNLVYVVSTRDWLCRVCVYTYDLCPMYSRGADVYPCLAVGHDSPSLHLSFSFLSLSPFTLYLFMSLLEVSSAYMFGWHACA